MIKRKNDNHLARIMRMREFYSLNELDRFEADVISIGENPQEAMIFLDAQTRADFGIITYNPDINEYYSRYYEWIKGINLLDY